MGDAADAQNLREVVADGVPRSCLCFHIVVRDGSDVVGACQLNDLDAFATDVDGSSRSHTPSIGLTLLASFITQT